MGSSGKVSAQWKGNKTARCMRSENSQCTELRRYDCPRMDQQWKSYATRSDQGAKAAMWQETEKMGLFAFNARQYFQNKQYFRYFYRSDNATGDLPSVSVHVSTYIKTILNWIKSLLREEEPEVAVTVDHQHGGLVTPLLSDVNKISFSPGLCSPFLHQFPPTMAGMSTHGRKNGPDPSSRRTGTRHRLLYVTPKPH